MKTKIDLKKIPVTKVLGVVSIIGAGLGAVFTEINSQNQEKTISNLVERVKKLEENK